MLAFVWNWIVTWVLGWGGVGAVVSIALWVFWWFSPVFKTQLLHAAVAATAFTIAATVFFTRGYDAGYDSALAAVARDDQDALDRVSAGKSAMANCRMVRGTWDVVTGTCK